MPEDSKSRKFGSINDFRHLNGWQKQEVIIGDRPDARIANFLFKTSVEHNWPSQWRAKYRGGYIKLGPEVWPDGHKGNGKIFDLANQTIDAAATYMFPHNRLTEILWRKQIAKNTIRDWTKQAGDKDVIALAQLVAESTGLRPPYPCRALAAELVYDCLEALSVIQLEEFAALLTTSSSLEDSNLPRKAAWTSWQE